MRNEELRDRTKKFSIAILSLLKTLPNRTDGWVLGRQVLRSATSVAANYRAACRARSREEFFAKLCIVVEEADETHFWLELINDARIISESEAELKHLIDEANQLVSIFSAARKSTKTGLKSQTKS